MPLPFTLTETAFAKVNLALHVRRRRADGYHELETVFAFVDQGDLVSGVVDDRLSLSISGPFSAGLDAGPDNLVLKAAQALQAAAGIATGARLHLDKRLPVAAGIGGGSADAAAALRLLARLWAIDDAAVCLETLAAGLGADVPACVASVACVGSGTGTDLSPVDARGISGVPVLLVNPGVPCPTGPVFRAWDGVDCGALDPADFRRARNDLERPAVGLVPQIATVLAALGGLPGVGLARMSGSGATCFALFADPQQRDHAAQQLAAQQPGWWQMTGLLR